MGKQWYWSESAFRSLASCPERFMRQTVKKERGPTSQILVKGILAHSALEMFIKGEVDSVEDAFLAIIMDKCIKDEYVERVLELAVEEEEILEDFKSGKIRKMDGSLYTAPRMTNAYKDRANSIRLQQRKDELNDPKVFRKLEMPVMEDEFNMLDLVFDLFQMVPNAAKIAPKLEQYKEYQSEGWIGVNFGIEIPGVARRFVGKFDFIGLKKEWEVKDFKTGGKQEELTMKARNSFQLTGMSRHVYEKYGEWPVRASLDFIELGIPAVLRLTKDEWCKRWSDFIKAIQMAEKTASRVVQGDYVPACMSDWPVHCKNCGFKQDCSIKYNIQMPE